MNVRQEARPDPSFTLASLASSCPGGHCRQAYELAWYKAIKALYSVFPDAIGVEGAAPILGGGTVQMSKDGDVLMGIGTNKGIPISLKAGGSAMFYYVDGGSNMTRQERLDILQGWQTGAGGCLVLCVSRSYSPTDSGPVGTWGLGIGSPGVSVTPTGYSWHIGRIGPKG
jgi:hypothetical protein